MKDRLQILDLLKIFAAWGVILIHLAPSMTPEGERLSESFSNWVIPLFFILSLYFFQSGFAARGKTSLGRNSGRLLLPFLCWSLIYLSLRLIKGILIHQPLSVNPVMLIFGGAAVHLYFLPELFLFQSICALLLVIENRIGWNRKKMRWGFPVIALLLYLTFRTAGRLVLFDDAEYLAILIRWAGEGFLYYAVASFARTILERPSAGIEKPPARKYMRIAGLLGVFILLQYSLLSGLISDPLLPVLCALFLILGLFPLKAVFIKGKMQTILTTSYGIFLIHHLYIEALEFLFARLTWSLPPYSLPAEIAVSLLVFFISMASVFLLRKWTWSSRLLLGE